MNSIQKDKFPPINTPLELLQFYRIFGTETKLGIKLRQVIDIYLDKSEKAITEGNEELKSYFQKKFIKENGDKK
jgi:hypothetical protein